MESLSGLFRRRITELGISNAELARRAKKSRSYVGNIINETAPTKSGQYELTPESVKDFAKALEISEIEILNAIGYASPETEDELTARIKDDLKISLQGGGKGISKQQKQQIIDMAVTIARGVIAEGEEETE